MSTGFRARLAAWLLVLAARPHGGLLWSTGARACAACSSGDATLSSAGTEQPFAGRMRSVLELRHQTSAFGQRGIDEVRVEEFRADLSSSWAPLAELVLSLDVPLSIRATSDANLARRGSRGLGEVELRAKWFVWRDREFAPRWLAAALATTKLPTAPWYRDAQGKELPPEAQPGTGSFDAGLGGSMAGFFGVLSSYAEVLFRTPLETRPEYRPGSSADATLSLQIQASTWIAVRGVSALRWDGRAREGSRVDPDSGGSFAFAGGDVLLAIGVDSQFALGFRLPMASDSNGVQREGARIGLALMSDW